MKYIRDLRTGKHIVVTSIGEFNRQSKILFREPDCRCDHESNTQIFHFNKGGDLSPEIIRTYMRAYQPVKNISDKVVNDYLLKLKPYDQVIFTVFSFIAQNRHIPIVTYALADNKVIVTEQNMSLNVRAAKVMTFIADMEEFLIGNVPEEEIYIEKGMKFK